MKYKINDLDKAYIAGLFDGEGSCNIASAGASMNISISNTRKVIIDWLVLFLGGRAGLGNKSQMEKRGHRPLWVWSLTSAKDITQFVDVINPYTKIKTQQLSVIKEAASYTCRRGSRVPRNAATGRLAPLTDEEKLHRAVLQVRLQKLNQGGDLDAL